VRLLPFFRAVVARSGTFEPAGSVLSTKRCSLNHRLLPPSHSRAAQPITSISPRGRVLPATSST
jgi:hypothetical protein